jgi:hypothetical protein
VKLATQNVMQVQSATDTPKRISIGERAVMVDGAGYLVIRYKEAGQPVDIIYPEEGTPLATGPSAVFRAAPNPNAARLFQNWMHSREAQQILVDYARQYSPHSQTVEKPGARARGQQTDERGSGRCAFAGGDGQETVLGNFQGVMTNCSLAEARRSNGRAALSTTGPCGTFQTCSQWEQSRHHFDLAQRPLVSAALIEAQSPPVSIMPISVAITTLMIMPVWLVRISAITHGRVGAAHRFAVTVAVPRRVGAEVRKALRERDSRRAQEHRQCQNDRLHGPILRCRCSENRESRGCVPEVCRVLATERRLKFRRKAAYENGR